MRLLFATKHSVSFAKEHDLGDILFFIENVGKHSVENTNQTKMTQRYIDISNYQIQTFIRDVVHARKIWII